MDEGESHVLQVSRDSLVEELLAIVGKKKHLVNSPAFVMHLRGWFEGRSGLQDSSDMMMAREYNFFPSETGGREVAPFITASLDSEFNSWCLGRVGTGRSGC